VLINVGFDINMVCFSQTGNTQKVAKAMADAFKGEGCQAQVIPLENADPAKVMKCDIFAVGSPCFASKVPSPVMKFLQDVPSLKGKPVFVFSTSGGAPGRVLYDLKEMCEKKGAHVVGGLLIRGELFYKVPCVLGRFPGRPNNEDLSKAKHFAQSIVKYLENDTDKFNEGHPKILKRRFNLYNFIGLMMTDTMIRILLPKPKVDKNTCDECGVCEDNCPTESITLTPYPVFNAHCIRCYRCLTVCPKVAIRINTPLANVAVFSLYNTWFERFFGDLEKGEILY
jgi:flavodoxin/NAD-dependent dihydropyrimidine dehydrogenase PreA subunit